MISRQRPRVLVALIARQKPKKGVSLCSLFSLLLTAAIIMGSISCLTSSPIVVPPGEISDFRGQASFYFSSPWQQGRVKLNFFFELPARARLEVLNPFGGLESILWLTGQKATLYLSAKRVYWQGPTSFPLREFLGGEISVEDLSRLILGQADELDNSWEITSGASGEVIKGRKEDLSFELKDYSPGSQVPRTIVFQKQNYSARIRLTKMKFNQISKAELFIPSFPAGAREVSWEEISNLWKK
ncbi:MAG: lipoprotein insertase outer membrane protein LolB [Acidobacteriota bacterium]|nr:lipoprotein insertase outer membrane protein LolB [Acidobacteriota bacterium]